MLSPGLHSRSLLFGFLLAADDAWFGTAWSFTWLVGRCHVRPILHWHVVRHLVRLFEEWATVIADDEARTHDVFHALIVVMSFIKDKDVRGEPTAHTTRADVVEDEAQLVVIQPATHVAGIKHYATPVGCQGVGLATQ